MKTPMSKVPQENRKSHISKTRPEIRDNLNSRTSEGHDFKGENITHNSNPPS